MKVFTNGTDTFVAKSLNDIPAVIEAHYGFTMESEGWELDEFEEVPGDKPITICNVHDRGVDDKETKTAAEWAAENGRGLLCSTEW